MLWTLVTIGVCVLVVVLAVGWSRRGRSRKKPEAGPMVGNLGTEEDLMRLEQAHDEGRMTDAEYHESRSKLLS